MINPEGNRIVHMPLVIRNESAYKYFIFIKFRSFIDLPIGEDDDLERCNFAHVIFSYPQTFSFLLERDYKKVKI